MNEELKPCPVCSCTEKADRVYSFGTDLPGGNGNIALCLRHTSGGYTLHAESIGHNEYGTDYCDNDDDAPINFCPVCGKQLNRRTQLVNRPLTLEELQARKTPVWCAWNSDKSGRESEWTLYYDSVKREGVQMWWQLKHYGSDWLAYDHPPEEAQYDE